MFVLPFHGIDPVIFQINSALSLNWYGVSYLVGLLFTMKHSDFLVSKNKIGMPDKIYTNFIFMGMLSIIIGGRLGEVFFYDFHKYMAHPIEILKTWRGGMSFHGGLLGAIIASWIYVRKNNVNFWCFADALATSTPIALALGRLANFINGEVYGRPSDLPWAMIFPQGGPVGRHPSQLYEAFFEGVVLFLVLRTLYPKLHKRPGIMFGFFIIGYGIARFCVEYFRDPETLSWIQSELFSGGQILSIIMILLGLFVTFLRKGNQHV
jgi:phosphatidylglycerol:prolipoprotein diacylglycerol transferase